MMWCELGGSPSAQPPPSGLGSFRVWGAGEENAPSAPPEGTRHPKLPLGYMTALGVP